MDLHWSVKLLLGALAVIALYLLISWWTRAPIPVVAPVAAAPVAPVCPYGGTVWTSPKGSSYCFYQGLDSAGGDISLTTTGFNTGLAACEANAKCLGLSSNGYYKDALKPYNMWRAWTKDPAKGFYTKMSAIGKY